MLDYNSDKLKCRLFETGEREFLSYCDKAITFAGVVCKSEIEILFLAPFFWIMKCPGVDYQAIHIEANPNIPADASKYGLVIRPQFPWKNYRIDFCFELSEEPAEFVFVECDGHEFHERTKDQAERDRRRDREIQAAGIPILRFTGREIYRSPWECGNQVLNFIRDRNRARSA